MSKFKVEEGLETNGTLTLSSSNSDIVASGNFKITGDVSSVILDTRYVFTSSYNGFTGSVNSFSASQITTNNNQTTFNSGINTLTQSLNLFSASHNTFSQSINQFTAAFTASVQSIGDARHVNNVNGYSGSISILAGPNVTINSGSGQIVITGSAGSAPTDISALNTFSQSINTLTQSLNLFSASHNTFSQSVNTFTASHNTFSQSINGFTASFTSSVQSIGDVRYVTNVNQFSGALTIVAGPNITINSGSGQIAITGSAGSSTDISALNAFSQSVNTFTASHNTFSQSVNTFTASQLTFNSGINTLTQSLNLFSASHNTFSQSVNTFTASFNIFSQSVNTFTASQITTNATQATLNTALNTFTASFNVLSQSLNLFSQSVNGFTASFTASVQSIGDARYANLTTFNTFSASVNIFTASQNIFSQSINSFTSSFSASVKGIGDTRYVLTSSYGPFTVSINSLTQSLNTFTASVVFPQTGEIILAISGSGNDNDPLRPTLRSGSYIAYPFATFTGALNRLITDVTRTLNFNVYLLSSTGTFEGYNVEGFTGKGDLIFPGTYKVSTVTSGSISGTAGSGSSTTSANKPTGAANWPSGSFEELRGKWIIVDSGGGASSDPYLPTVRQIQNNTTSSISFEEILGFNSGSQFRIVDPATTITLSSINAISSSAACVAVVGNKNRIKFGGIKFSSSVVSYGLLGYRSDEVYVQGCDFVTNFYMGASMNNVGYVSINDSWFHSSSYLEVQNSDRVELNNILQNSGAIDVYNCRNVSVSTNAQSNNANSVKLRNILKAQLTANIFSASNTPVILENIHYFTIGTLTGSNPGATTAVTFAKGGVYNVQGAVISAGTNDFTIEGFADSWSTLSTYGSYEARGTNVNWGSGYTLIKGSGLRIDARSPTPGDELIVQGDVVWSGQEKAYGFKISIDNGSTASAYLHLTAAADGRSNKCKYIRL